MEGMTSQILKVDDSRNKAFKAPNQLIGGWINALASPAGSPQPPNQGTYHLSLVVNLGIPHLANATSIEFADK